jgi:hypothetical protein
VVDIDKYERTIREAYDCLARRGKESLDSKGRAFHVGGTKILHWINPDLFIMIDSNVARVFRVYHGVCFKDATQPRYTAKKYLDCLRHAQSEIHAYGYERFRALEPGTPIARIVDKIAFVQGIQLAMKT